MNKSEVYSWRLSRSTKVALQDEARRAGKSIGAVLDGLAAEWLRARREGGAGDTAGQARLRAALSPTLGAIASGHLDRAERAGAIVRRRLRRQRAR